LPLRGWLSDSLWVRLPQRVFCAAAELNGMRCYLAGAMATQCWNRDQLWGCWGHCFSSPFWFGTLNYRLHLRDCLSISGLCRDCIAKQQRGNHRALSECCRITRTLITMFLSIGRRL
jgi:hypothetical protein